MAVYVDDARIPYGRMTMCHMAADTSEELDAMAATIGVPAMHVQAIGTPQEHFDICLAKRRLAVRAGAVEVTQRDMVELRRAKRRASAVATAPTQEEPRP